MTSSTHEKHVFVIEVKFACNLFSLANLIIY